MTLRAYFPRRVRNAPFSQAKLHQLHHWAEAGPPRTQWADDSTRSRTKIQTRKKNIIVSNCQKTNTFCSSYLFICPCTESYHVPATTMAASGVTTPSPAPNGDITPDLAWVVQKFGGTSVGKFANNIVDQIILYECHFSCCGMISALCFLVLKQCSRMLFP
jgi:hypothetical protein